MNGLCECGCGEKTKIITETNLRIGRIKGEQNRYIHGHHARGVNNPHYNGGRCYVPNDGVHITMPGHPNARKNGTVLEHVLVCSAALGKPIPEGVIIHHWDRDNSNNAPKNLLICQDHAYHMLIHMRQRAYEQSGHTDYKHCHICKKWFAKEDMSKNKTCTDGCSSTCKPCHRENEHRRRMS